jgi:hypothetical protein
MKRTFLFVSLMGVLLLFGSFAAAQSFQVTSTNQNFVVTPGSTIPFSANYNIDEITDTGAEMCGFQFQYSHDTSLLEIDPAGFPTTLGAVAALNGGAGPDFIDGQIVGSGFTIGIVFSFTFDAPLAFNSVTPVLRIDYETIPGALNGITNDIVTQIFMSNDLGSPIIDNIMSDCAGGALPLIGQPFDITFMPPPPLVFEISSPDQSLVATGPNGGSVSFGADFSLIQGGDPADLTATQGFQFAYRHDPVYLQVTSIDEGSALAALDGGSGAEYFDGTIFPDGFTVGCIFDFQGAETITFDTSQEIVGISYSSVPGAFNGVDDAVDTALTLASDLGSPPVDPVIVVGNGIAIFASGFTVNLSIQPNPPFTLVAVDQTASFSPTTGAGSFTASFTLQENPDNPTFPTDTQGFSFGVAHDSSLLTATACDSAAVLDDLDAGNGASFFDCNLFAGGVTFGCVYSFAGTELIQFVAATELVTASYDTVAAALAGTTDDVITILDITNTLGTPPVVAIVVVDSQASAMFGQDGTITLIPGGGFQRGDVNIDGTINIADPISLLAFLFTGGSVNCLLSSDINDDNTVNIADPIYLLGFLFTAGVEPPSPFGFCGADPTPGALSCDDFDSAACP